MRYLVLASLLSFVMCGSSVAQEASKTGIVIDKENKAVRIEAKIAPRKLPNLDQVYPIEVIASWAAPKGKKAHETVLIFEVNPSEIHKALESLGLKPGKPAKGEGTKAEGPEVAVFIEIKSADGSVRKLPISRVLIDPKTKKPMPASVKFVFTGSVQTQVDPNKPEKIYGADASGTLIALFPVTDETVLQTSLTMKEEPYLKMDTNKDILPKEGTPVTLIIELANK